MDQINPQDAEEPQPRSKGAQARARGASAEVQQGEEEKAAGASDTNRDNNRRDRGINNAVRAFAQIRR